MADNDGTLVDDDPTMDEDDGTDEDEGEADEDDTTDDDMGTDDEMDDDGTDEDTEDEGEGEMEEDDNFEGATTPLVQAIIDGEPVDVIRGILMEAPGLAQQTVRGTYPLSYAVSYGAPVGVARALHRRWPGSVRARDPWGGYMPLHGVGRKTPFETVEFLLGVYPGALRELAAGGLPIHYAIGFPQASSTAVRALVKGFPESLLVTNGAGLLPIHFAALTEGEHQADIVAFLADQRPATILVATPNGQLPVHRALLLPRSGPGVIQRLAVEAIPEATRLGLMHFLLRELDGRVESDYLVENAGALAQALPATLRATNAQGSLPLHFEVSRANPSPQLVQVLVNGWIAALDVRDGSGRVPLQLAHANPSTPVDVIYCLVRAKPDGIRTGFA